MKMKYRFIATLSVEVQHAIENDLLVAGLTKKDIIRAMNSRLCDLEDTINITSYLELPDIIYFSE